MFTIISFFQKLIKGGVGIRAGGLENFSKINKRGGGTINRYSRVLILLYSYKILQCMLHLHPTLLTNYYSNYTSLHGLDHGTKRQGPPIAINIKAMQKIAAK